MPAIGCREFSTWWEAPDIPGAPAGWKRLGHLEKGLVHFKRTSFQADDDHALKRVIDRQV